MENLWNLKELSLPPLCTYKVTTSVEIDIEKFHTLCGDLTNFFTRYPQLHSESLLLSRIIYRMKQKFRTSKDFKALEKLTKSLQRYFSLNLSSDLQSLKELLPDKYSDELYLPSRNLVEYVLVRFQGVSKLMEYIIEIITDVAHMLTIRIYIGHFWKIGFILFSVVSRIYILSRYTLRALCNFYSQLLPISKQLKTVGKVWLPENYVFPQNLEEWLDVDWSKLDGSFEELQESRSVPQIFHYFNLVDDSDNDIEIMDESALVNEYEVPGSNELRNNIKLNTFSGFSLGEDIGEIIQVVPDSINEILEEEDLGESIEIMSDSSNKLDDHEIGIEKNDQKSNLKKPLSKGKLRKNKKKEKSSMKVKLFAARGDNYKVKTNHSNKKAGSNDGQTKQENCKAKKKCKNIKSKREKSKHSSSQKFFKVD